MFFFPAQMIHCTRLCKQWVDPSWISGSNTAPIPGSGREQQLHTFFSTASLSVLQQNTSAGANLCFTHTSRTRMECGGERELQCALSRVTGSGELLGTGHPPLPGTPRLSLSLCRLLYPGQSHHSRLELPEQSLMLRVNWLSPLTVP